MLARRLLIFVALLMGLAALAAAVAPPETRTGSAPAPTAVPSPTAGIPDQPELSGRPEEIVSERDVPGEPLLRRLDAAGSRQIVEARTGERVRLSVASEELVSVQIGVDGPIEAVDPDAPARFSLLYDAPTELPIRVIETDRTIGVLRVSAASAG
ncbi:MAG: hypothetical protein AVDCRST_MAG30-1641 [uncultured Solirubrobacteraceae bacterium]|uniref:Uncharacterized protein n=1 Tax=uncultured Solirubrobacteraceae bacterium TaxID=1162706 RepID=A0A6J4SJY2_9ACTN|nr:MAG: hypothetical protein AVDCRST_MAG30-1641 [uncultured Solirubrobacteraceae bacterium]